jgi:hypothetical protein
MSVEPGLCRVAAECNHLPPMPTSAMLHWDGISAVSRSIGS